VPATAEPTMPKSSKPKRDDKAVKIDRGVALKAKMIADTRKITVAEYLSDLLRPLVDRDFPPALKSLNKSHGSQP
jgi:hypothetical protein